MSAAVAIPLMLTAGVLQAVSTYQSGQAQAKALTQQAAMTRISGAEEVRQEQRQAAFLRGSQEEAAGAGGVESTTGSPLEVAQEDAREARYNQLKTQFAYNTKAATLEFEAKQTKKAATIGAVTGLLTTGAQAFYAAKAVPSAPETGTGSVSPFSPSGGASDLTSKYGYATRAY